MKALALVRVDRKWIVACVNRRLKDGTMVLSPLTKPASLQATNEDLRLLSKDEAVSGDFAFCPVCDLVVKVIDGLFDDHSSLEHDQCPGSRKPVPAGGL